jgi:hypothetical protein
MAFIEMLSNVEDFPETLLQCTPAEDMNLDQAVTLLRQLFIYISERQWEWSDVLHDLARSLRLSGNEDIHEIAQSLLDHLVSTHGYAKLTEFFSLRFFPYDVYH